MIPPSNLDKFIVFHSIDGNAYEFHIQRLHFSICNNRKKFHKMQNTHLLV